jgi:hypothetical protein
LTKPIRLHGKRVSESEFCDYILKLIEKGVTSTTEIAKIIGKDYRTARRYLVKMGELKLIILDEDTGRLAKTVQQQSTEQYKKLSTDEFAKIPEVATWIKKCIARNVEPKVIRTMLGTNRNIFDLMKTHPKTILYSKKFALEFWENFSVEFKKLTGKPKMSQMHRVHFKNLLDAHDITFGHGMGKAYGLGSEHDSYKKYAGAVIPPDVIYELVGFMDADKNLRSKLWFRIGLRTAARAGALASMTWDRIYFDQQEEFETATRKEKFVKLEVHETKDKRGDFHCGKNGEWKRKFVPCDVIELLKQWKALHPEFNKFIWFADTGSDVLNQKKIANVAALQGVKLAQYYKKILHKLSPKSREYIVKRPSHIMRHTNAQLLKNAGFSDEQISVITGHRDKNTVSWYCEESEEKQKEIATQAIEVQF